MGCVEYSFAAGGDVIADESRSHRHQKRDIDVIVGIDAFAIHFVVDVVVKDQIGGRRERGDFRQVVDDDAARGEPE